MKGLITAFCWFLVLWTIKATAQPVIRYSQPTALANIARHCLVLTPGTENITYDSLLRGNYAFSEYHQRYINLGISNKPFWLKFRLLNTSGVPVYLQVGNAALDSIDVYEQQPGGLVIHRTGTYLPFHQREFPDRYFLFSLKTVQSQPLTVYLRVRHARGTQFSLYVASYERFNQKGAMSNLYSGMYYGLILGMVFYNLFLFFTLRDMAYLYYICYVFFMGLLNAVLLGHGFKFLWPAFPQFNQYADVIAILVGLSGILFVIKFLEVKTFAPGYYKLYKVLALLYVINVLPILAGFATVGTIMVELLSLVVIFSFFFCAYAVLRQHYRPARFFLIAWSFLLLSVVVFIAKDFGLLLYHPVTANALQIGSAIEAVLLSMALANRINVYKLEKERAQDDAIVALKEKRLLIMQQKTHLEQEVEMRTREIREKHDELLTALENLKQTQAQLIQQEKMASLGEMTAGIAHEIQNPLNFVNNFSETTQELVDELLEMNRLHGGEADIGRTELLDNLKENIKKISDHGRRAEAIVRNMMQHTQVNMGKVQPVDLNALIKEYLNLSLYGFKNKEKNFDADIVTQLDPAVGVVNIVPQDIARVLVNLFNNAWYAMCMKQKADPGAYRPQLVVATANNNGGVQITIRDNGCGINAFHLNKVFQPFFTTKPSGTGTGLGLSLSHDIIKKEHNGDIAVSSMEGVFTEFTIGLPVKALTSATSTAQS